MGNPSRIELYGCVALIALALMFIAERLAVDRVLIDGLLLEKVPIFLQNNNNNQQVTIEDPRERLIRELAEKNGYKSNEHGK